MLYKEYTVYRFYFLTSVSFFLLQIDSSKTQQMMMDVVLFVKVIEQTWKYIFERKNNA